MTIERVGILGSGIMGSGIAEVAAKAGVEVVLRSRKQASADAMVSSLEKSLAKQVERGKLEQADADAVRGRVSATDSLADLADCDLVLESVVEDLDVKRALFTELDGIVKDERDPGHQHLDPPGRRDGRSDRTAPTRSAASTSSTPLPAMSLVEVIAPLTASDETVATARGFAEQCGKNPVEVKDRAGFIVNALLFPYLNNAVRMLELGTASAEDIDTAMKGGCNFPMGPLALLDLVGLDTSLAILDALYDEFRDPNYAAVPALRRMVAAGQLGRKSGKGFYDYSKK
jgi:3-hydroxybutyryl-CoA dehydrogenase